MWVGPTVVLLDECWVAEKDTKMVDAMELTSVAAMVNNLVVPTVETTGKVEG
jgi:hypothetical protein